MEKEKVEERMKMKSALFKWFIQWEKVDTAVEDLEEQSVASWSEYLEYDREGRPGDPVLKGGFTSLVNLLTKRMEVVVKSVY